MEMRKFRSAPNEEGEEGTQLFRRKGRKKGRRERTGIDKNIQKKNGGKGRWGVVCN